MFIISISYIYICSLGPRGDNLCRDAIYVNIYFTNLALSEKNSFIYFFGRRRSFKIVLFLLFVFHKKKHKKKHILFPILKLKYTFLKYVYPVLLVGTL